LIRDVQPFGLALLEESSNDYTEFVITSGKKMHRELYSTLLQFRYGQATPAYSFSRALVVISVRRRDSNMALFLQLTIAPILLLIQNVDFGLTILCDWRELNAGQQEYFDLLEEFYDVELAEMPRDEFFRIETDIIILQPPNKKFVKSFEFSTKDLPADCFGAISPTRPVDFLANIERLRAVQYNGARFPRPEAHWGKFFDHKRISANTAIQAFNDFADKVFISSNSTGVEGVDVNVLFVRRDLGSSGRYLENEREIQENFPDWKMVRWSEFSQREKICQSRGAQVLIGLAGAGLSAGYFMRPGGAIIEIHPEEWGKGYQPSWKVLADAKGLHHIGVLSSPIMVRGEQRLTSVAIPRLRRAIDVAFTSIAQSGIGTD